MNQLDAQQLAHNINQELTVEQAIADKTAMVMQEQEDARAAVEAYGLNKEEEQKPEEDDDLDDLDLMDEDGKNL